MKRLLLLLLSGVFAMTIQAQTTAQDWTKYDCEGNLHHLYSELDSGNVILLEFVMQCGSCLSAAGDLNTIYHDYQVSHPGKVRYYMMDYSTDFNCDTMIAWSHGIDCVTFLDGSHEVSYYGPFGMPTIVILGGINHQVYYTGIGFNPTYDIQYIRDAIDSALATTGISEIQHLSSVRIFPNPSNEAARINYSLKVSGTVAIEIFDPLGRLVHSVFTGNKSAGENTFVLDTAVLPEGIYCVAVSGGGSVSKLSLSVVR
jgi:hypothetical protein